jgi:hypothetical protein
MINFLAKGCSDISERSFPTAYDGSGVGFAVGDDPNAFGLSPGIEIVNCVDLIHGSVLQGCGNNVTGYAVQKVCDVSDPL